MNEQIRYVEQLLQERRDEKAKNTRPALQELQLKRQLAMINHNRVYGSMNSR